MEKEVSWTEFKNFIESRNVKHQMLETDAEYSLIAADDWFTVSHHILKEDTPTNDQTDYETNYKSLANQQLQKTTTNLGIPKVAVYEPEGFSRSIPSHDFTDKTTWYPMSQRVENETPTLDSGKIYDLANDYVIDMRHGKVTGECCMASTYAIVVTDNSVTLEEDSDYTVDYVNGKITFDSEYTINGPLLVTYSYATTSDFIIKPDTGKITRISDSEIQFTKDIGMNPVNFEIWGYNPEDLPNKMLYEKNQFKSLKDIINIARKGTGAIPLVQGFTQEILVFPFTYDRMIDLKDSLGMELRVKIDSDVPMTGEWGTITIYTMEEDE